MPSKDYKLNRMSSDAVLGGRLTEKEESFIKIYVHGFPEDFGSLSTFPPESAFSKPLMKSSFDFFDPWGYKIKDLTSLISIVYVKIAQFVFLHTTLNPPNINFLNFNSTFILKSKHFPMIYHVRINNEAFINIEQQQVY